MKRYAVATGTVRSEAEGDFVYYADIVDIIVAYKEQVEKLQHTIESMESDFETRIEAIIKAAVWDKAEAHPEEPTLKDDDTDVLIIDSDLPLPSYPPNAP